MANVASANFAALTGLTIRYKWVFWHVPNRLERTNEIVIHHVT